MTQHKSPCYEDDFLVAFDESEETRNLQSDIILEAVNVTGSNKSDLSQRMDALKKHSALNIEVVQACREMFKDKYQSMVCLYVENSHERLGELFEALEDEDMVSMIRPSHTLKVTSVQMGASKLFYMAKELEAFVKAACKGEPSPNDFQQSKGMIDEIQRSLDEAESTFSQLLSLNIGANDTEA